MLSETQEEIGVQNGGIDFPNSTMAVVFRPSCEGKSQIMPPNVSHREESVEEGKTEKASRGETV